MFGTTHIGYDKLVGLGHKLNYLLSRPTSCNYAFLRWRPASVLGETMILSEALLTE